VAWSSIEKTVFKALWANIQTLLMTEPSSGLFRDVFSFLRTITEFEIGMEDSFTFDAERIHRPSS
jgi:hypothetical protein